jgi:alpha-beta hydrolase superfamily lysophospholipase
VWTTVEGERVHGVVVGDGPRGVILVHGLVAEHREMGALPAALARRGLAVLAIDLRCHGKSEGRPRGFVTRERVLADLEAWKRALVGRGVELAAIGGHSLGAAMTLWCAPRLGVAAWFGVAVPSTITGELSGAEIKAYRLGGALHRALSTVGLRGAAVPYKVRPEDILDDREAISRMKRDRIVQTKVPLANVAHLLALDAVAWASECKCPGLVAACTNDRVVTHEHTREVYLAYAGPKAWRDIPGAHSCFFDEGGDKAASVVADWLEATLS